MKKILALTILTSMILTVGCGKTVGVDTNELTEPSTVVTTGAVETTTVHVTTTQPTTAPTTFKKTIPEDVVLTAADTVEVYTDATIADLILDTNTVLLEPDTLIDTEDIGQGKVTVTFGYEGDYYEKEITYSVVDTTAPLLLNSGWNPYAKKGQPFDLNSIVGFCDNYDRHPELTYSGTVDTSEVGSYPITATVTDSSGNYTSWDLTVFVLNEIPAPEDNNRRVPFSEFMDYYCYENVSYGIDVSAWQTNVDYDAVKAEGVEFVLMRMGYAYSPNNIKKDDYYDRNIANATAAGLDVGVYFYSAASTEDEIKEQAHWILDQLDGRQLDFPIAFDWEEWGRFQQYGMNIRDLNNLFELFCEEVEKEGYTAMLYSSKNFLNNFWENKNDRTVWLAHYVDETDYEGSFAIWQASAYGRIDGIVGDVDMNIRLNAVPLD